MKHCMLMSVLSLLFSLLLPVTVQHAAGISGGEALPEVSPAASAAPGERPAQPRCQKNGGADGKIVDSAGAGEKFT